MTETDAQQQFEQVKAVKQAHEKELLALPNVVGCGVGFRYKEGRRTQTMAIVVMVNRKLPAALLSPDEIIPRQIEGIPVDVQEVGQLTAH